MTVFAVIPLGENDRLRQRLEQVTQELYDETAPQLYFLSYDGAASELRDALGLGDPGGGGEGVVLRVTANSGYTYRTLWDWLEKRER